MWSVLLVKPPVFGKKRHCGIGSQERLTVYVSGSEERTENGALFTEENPIQKLMSLLFLLTTLCIAMLSNDN